MTLREGRDSLAAEQTSPMNVLAFELISFYGVYTVCFWVGLIFAIISGVMSGVFSGAHADSPHIGGDGGADGHVGGDVHGLPDFPAVGPVTISTFITVFGGCGMIFSKIEATQQPYISLPISLAIAFGGSYLVFLLFSKFFYGQQSSSEAQQHELIGQTATVITSIPAQGVGEIAFFAGASRQNAQARSVDGQPIATGEEVTIAKIVGGSYYVTRGTVAKPSASSSPSKQ